MVIKIIKGILLVVLTAYYLNNVISYGDSWYTAVLYNRINYIILVAILYLASSFVKYFEVLCALVFVGGLLFHSYMYYITYNTPTTSFETSLPQAKKCQGKGVNWYTKLNDSCY